MTVIQTITNSNDSDTDDFNIYIYIYIYSDTKRFQLIMTVVQTYRRFQFKKRTLTRYNRLQLTMILIQTISVYNEQHLQ